MFQLLDSLARVTEPQPDSFAALDQQLNAPLAKREMERLVASKMAQRTSLPSILKSCESRQRSIERCHEVIEAEMAKLYSHSLVLNGLEIVKDKLEAEARAKRKAARRKEKVDRLRIDAHRKAAEERARAAQARADALKLGTRPNKTVKTQRSRAVPFYSQFLDLEAEEAAEDLEDLDIDPPPPLELASQDP
jgi:hypothetical protein